MVAGEEVFKGKLSQVDNNNWTRQRTSWMPGKPGRLLSSRTDGLKT